MEKVCSDSSRRAGFPVFRKGFRRIPVRRLRAGCEGFAQKAWVSELFERRLAIGSIDLNATP